MTELQLHKFITENEIEHHQYEHLGQLDIIVMIDFDKIKEFTSILDASLFDDEGIDIILKQGYVCVWMQEICDYYGVNMYSVFEDYSQQLNNEP